MVPLPSSLAPARRRFPPNQHRIPHLAVALGSSFGLSVRISRAVVLFWYASVATSSLLVRPCADLCDSLVHCAHHHSFRDSQDLSWSVLVKVWRGYSTHLQTGFVNLQAALALRTVGAYCRCCEGCCTKKFPKEAAAGDASDSLASPAAIPLALHPRLHSTPGTTGIMGRDHLSNSEVCAAANSIATWTEWL